MNKREILFSLFNPFNNRVSRWIVERETGQRKANTEEHNEDVIEDNQIGNIIQFPVRCVLLPNPEKEPILSKVKNLFFGVKHESESLRLVGRVIRVEGLKSGSCERLEDSIGNLTSIPQAKEEIIYKRPIDPSSA